MNDGLTGAVCPQCGSAAAVHSIEELATLAKSQLAGQGYAAAPQQGYAGQPQPGPVPGYAADPQAGPVPGYAGQPQPGPVPGYAADPQAGPVPGYAGQPQPGPGYAAQPRSGPLPGRRQGGFGIPGNSGGDDFPLGDDLAGAALTAATQFIGRAIGRRLQRTLGQQVMPTLAAKQEAVLREQIAIAERHPDLRACLTDKVVFLAGGSRVLPLGSIGGALTLEQADVLVAKLRDG